MALVAGAVWAQSPFEIAPQTYHLDFENEYVRIVRVTLAAHETVPVHDHPSTPTVYVYTQDGGPIRFTHTRGPVLERAAVKQGQLRFSLGHPETHAVENLSDRPNCYLRVEMKMDKEGLYRRNTRVGLDETLENSMLRISRRPNGAPEYPAVDVDYKSGRGVFRSAGEEGTVPDLRIELKSQPVG